MTAKRSGGRAARALFALLAFVLLLGSGVACRRSTVAPVARPPRRRTARGRPPRPPATPVDHRRPPAAVENSRRRQPRRGEGAPSFGAAAATPAAVALAVRAFNATAERAVAAATSRPRARCTTGSAPVAAALTPSDRKTSNRDARADAARDDANRPPQLRERDDMDIERVNLPGIGMRHSFTTGRDRRLGVVSHHTGRRDLVVYDKDDPDSAVVSVALTPAEANALAELLGTARLVERLAELNRQVEGWSPSRSRWSRARRTPTGRSATPAARTRTGASIVAVVRDRQVFASPRPDFRFRGRRRRRRGGHRRGHRARRAHPQRRIGDVVHHGSILLIEFGAIVLALGILAAVASRFSISPIPLYLLAGLAFGQGGVLPLATSQEFVGAGAEIGVILLLFTLGLEYTAQELVGTLRLVGAVRADRPGAQRHAGRAGGPAAGLGAGGRVVMGGVTYVTSSGITAKVMGDLGWLGNRETPLVLSLLVFEDLTMAAYLPILTTVLAGVGFAAGLLSLGVAAATVTVVLVIALRYGRFVEKLVQGDTDEVLLLKVLGLTLLVAGVTQELQVSAAVGAFLVGIALSVHWRTRRAT
jgi:K+/H+ antiporter YhaU regulatory subunit KhtT